MHRVAGRGQSFSMYCNSSLNTLYMHVAAVLQTVLLVVLACHSDGDVGSSLL